MKKAYIYETKLGKIMITEENQAITGLDVIKDDGYYNDLKTLTANGSCCIEESDLIKEAASQLTQYLEGNRSQFTVKLSPAGTEFQKKVWDALLTIPYGETRSYKDIAVQIGNEKACRAVGMANHNNPIMCLIPCHRVIGANGSLTGYAGGLSMKEKLLNMEKERKLKNE